MSDHTFNEDDVRKRMTYNGSDPDRLTTGKSSRMGQPRTVEKDTTVTKFRPSDGSRAVVDGYCRTGHNHPERQVPANPGTYENYFQRAEYASGGILREPNGRETRGDFCNFTQGSRHLSMERMRLNENSHRIAVDRSSRTNDGDVSGSPFQKDAASRPYPTSKKDAELKDTAYWDPNADRLKTIRSSQTCQYQTRGGDTQVEELWTSDGGRSVVTRGNVRGDDRLEPRDNDAVDAEVGNQRAFGLSSGGEIVEESLTPSRYRRFPSIGRGLATLNKESCRANELMLVEGQRIQVDPHGVERPPAEEESTSRRSIR